MNYGTLAIMKKFIPLMLHFLWPRSPWSTLFIKKILTNGCFKNYTAIVIWRALSNWSQRKWRHYKVTTFFLIFFLFVSRKNSNNFFLFGKFYPYPGKKHSNNCFFNLYWQYCRLGQYADLGQYFPVQNGKKVIILLIFIYVTSKKQLLSHLYCRGWQS